MELAEKNLQGGDKKLIVRRHIQERIYYTDGKFVPLAALVQAIVRREFEEETSKSSRASAAKGLTPFAIPLLSDDETDRINEQAQALESATSTTVSDIAATKILAEAPKSYTHLLKLLKRFGNLLFALFGKLCPLFKEVNFLVEELEDHSDTAQAAMSRSE